VDGAGNAYVTGQTESTATSFPETTGVFQAAHGGGLDAFVAKVNPTGSALVYASFLGGSGSEVGEGIAVDAAGNAYVTGSTDSAATSFPETTGVFQGANGGGTDAFVAKVNPTGSALAYASFLGGDGDEIGYGIAVDGTGNAYVTGQTESAATTFPETTGVFQAAHGGGLDAFVAKIATVNDVPTISDIASKTISEDTSTGPIGFTVGDVETPAGSLTLSRTSSNTALVPVANIVFGGSGAARTVTLTPAANQSGSTTVRITVSDGVASAFDEFTLTVRAVNDAPSFTKGPDQSVVQDRGAQSVTGWASGLSTGDTGQSLSFVVTNTNNALFSAQPAVSPAGTLTYTSAAGASGTATVTVVARDDGGTANGGVDASAPQSFTITVVADTVAPVCTVTRIGTDGEGRRFVEVSARDAASGITRIDTTTAVNIITPVTTSPSPWAEGTTDPVVITATKANQALSSQVAFVITDRAGNRGSCM
jgi:hypothetical protein